MKRFLSVLTALVIIITAIPFGIINASAAAYNATAALDFAEKNWDSGVELCAGFVSNCLRAGGIDVMERSVKNLYDALKDTHGKAYVLKTNGPYIYMSENVGKLSAGDPVFYYCNSCKSFDHTVLCGGCDEAGRMTDYAHNNPHHNVTTYNYWGCNNWTIYSVHVANDSNPAAKTLSVQYNVNGGSIKSDKYKSVSGRIYESDKLTCFSQEMEYDKSVSGGLINASEFGIYKTGYEFAGWGTEAGGGKVFSDSASVKPSDLSTRIKNESCTVELYAQWKPCTYTVTYNANGGNGAPSSQTKTYGQALKLSDKKPNRSGLEFAGWNTRSDGKGTTYKAGGSYTANSDVTLYAVWSKDHVHSYVKESSTPATCVEFGYASYACKCGYGYTETIQPLGHSVHWVYTQRPTIYKTGVGYEECTRCKTRDPGNTTIAKATADVNSDGRVNSSDAVCILLYATGDSGAIVGERALLNADTNGDGLINSSDALTVLRISVGDIKL